MSHKKKNIPGYEPPRAMDLSGIGVLGSNDIFGQTAGGASPGGGPSPQGNCSSGPTPYYNCVAGPGYSTGDCSSGPMPNDTSNCNPGGYHTFPACDFGNNAATLCLSGAGQQ